MGKYEGASRVALKPKTTEQAAALLRHCFERRLAVVPQARRRLLPLCLVQLRRAMKVMHLAPCRAATPAWLAALCPCLTRSSFPPPP